MQVSHLNATSWFKEKSRMGDSQTQQIIHSLKTYVTEMSFALSLEHL